MADNRNAYKGQIIGLELHEEDIPSGVTVTSVDLVIILQEKELCFSTASITLLSPSTWGVTIDSNLIKYSGIYNDRWILNGGTDWAEKTLTLTDVATTIPSRSTGNYNYYSKDLSFEVGSDGDLLRLYDENSIVGKMKSVLMTIKGSLINEPNHGTNLYRFLFSMSPTVADDIRLEVETQLQIQVPQIKIRTVKVIPSDYNAYNVSVDFFNISSTNPNELLNMTNLVSVEQVLG